jgi:polysaccharide export outer membrane protein
MTISRSNVRKLRFALTYIFVASVLFVGALAQEQASQPAQAAKTTQNSPQTTSAFDAVTAKDNTPPRDSSLRIGEGDLLEFSVYNVPELASKIRVSSNGDAYLPLIDYVHVADLTVEEAQTVIEKKLLDGGFVKDPHVTLFVDQFASQGVSVLGEVARPGVLPVLGQQRLFDVISAAGGLTDKAGKNVSITHRNQQNKPVVVELQRHLEDSSENNIQVYPGDTIIVRKADIVYVVGDVARPSGFVMERNGLTVLQAVALAGGTTQSAKLNGAQIIRKTEAGNVGTPIELKKILQAKAPDVAMQPDDILFVPSSVGRMATKRVVDAAVQIATFAAVRTY